MLKLHPCLDFTLVCERCRQTGPTLTRLERPNPLALGLQQLRSFDRTSRKRYRSQISKTAQMRQERAFASCGGFSAQLSASHARLLEQRSAGCRFYRKYLTGERVRRIFDRFVRSVKSAEFLQNLSDSVDFWSKICNIAATFVKVLQNSRFWAKIRRFLTNLRFLSDFSLMAKI